MQNTHVNGGTMHARRLKSINATLKGLHDPGNRDRLRPACKRALRLIPSVHRHQQREILS